MKNFLKRTLVAVTALALMFQATVSGLPITPKTNVFAETTSVTEEPSISETVEEESVEEESAEEESAEENPIPIISSDDVEYEASNVIGNTEKLSNATGGVTGFTLTGDETIEGDFYLIAGTLDLAGYELTINGNFVQGGGNVLINGGTLNVNGNYRIQTMTENNGAVTYGISNGYLVMTNEEDKVNVSGNFITQAYHNDGKLSAGTLTISGDFQQMFGNFITSGTHKVVFDGDKEHNINLSSGVSYFTILDVTDEKITTPNNNIGVITELLADGAEFVGDQYVNIFENTILPDVFNGNLRIADHRTFQKDLHIKGYMIIEATVNLNGNEITVDNYISGKDYSNFSIEFNHGQLICNGNFNMIYYYSQISMRYPEDKLTVKGDFNWVSAYDLSMLIDGKIEVAGNCDFNNYAFRPRENHEFILNGSTKQTVNFTNTNNNFNKLVIKNTSEEGVEVLGEFTINEMINESNCKVTLQTDGQIGFTLTGDETIEGDFYLIAGILDLAGYELTINGNLVQGSGTVLINGGTLNVMGDLIQSNGKLSVSGGTLNVNGDYRIQTMTENNGTVTYGSSNGYLVMTNEEDEVNVSGNFITQSNYYNESILSAGMLTISGDFQQMNGITHNFRTSGTHKVVFDGDKEHNINFASTSSYFTVLDVTDEKITTPNNNICVITELSADGAEFVGDQYVNIFKNTVLPDVFNGNLRIAENYTFQKDLHIKGYMIIAATVNLNGNKITVDNYISGKEFSDFCIDFNHGQLICNGNFNMIYYYNQISMKYPEDKLTVKGDFNWDGGYYSNTLTDGKIEVAGNCVFNRSEFTPSENHEFILNGSTKQTVKFTNTNNKFNKLQITKPLSQYVFLNSSGEEVSAELFYNELIENYVDTVPPTAVTGLFATELQTTSVKLCWNSSSEETGVMGYEIYRNGESIFITTNTEFTDSSLNPETSYTYEIYAFDESRNYSLSSEPISVTTTKDTSAPTVPLNLKIIERTGSGITISWTPSQDNVKTIGYKIYRDGKEIADVKNDNHFRDTGLTARTEYSYEIAAYDEAENLSELSTSVSGYPIMPSIERIIPENLSEIGGKSCEIQVIFNNSGNSTDNKVNFEYKKSGESDDKYLTIPGSFSVQQNYSPDKLLAKYLWDLTNLNGTYDVRVTLYDADNNTDVKEVSYTFDTAGSATPKNFNVESNNGAVELKWSPSVSANCNSYKIYRSDNEITEFEEISVIKGADIAYYRDKNVIPGEQYFYKISAVSKYGIEGALSEGISVIVTSDSEPPSVNSVNPDKSRVKSKVSVSVKAIDNIAVEKIKLEYSVADGENLILIEEKTVSGEKADFIWDTTELEDGAYLISATAYDTSGNISDVFTKAYVVDNSGPEKVIITENECSSASSFVSIRWADISEPNFGYYIVECQDENGEFSEVGRTSTVAGMHIQNLSPDTPYAFRVVAYDDLGNRGIESDIIELTTTSDIIVPGIKSFYPASSAFNNKIDISIASADNISIDKLVLKYSYDTGDEKTWSDLETLNCTDTTTSNTFSYSFDISNKTEGDIFVQAVVYDKAGNASQPCVNTFKIDKTAPEKISDLSANGDNGNVHLVWSSVSEDTVKFDIYRAEDGKSMYSKIATVTTKDYYDIAVEFGATYTYKILAIDIAGNVSEYSNEVIAQVAEDTEKPRVLGFNFASGSYLAGNPKLDVVVNDNNKLSLITVSYRQADSTDGIWLEIGKFSLNSNYQSVSFTWNTDELNEGKYIFNAVTEDISGNISDPFTAEYILDKTAPAEPVLELLQGNWKIDLEWNDVKTTDFGFYRLYRKGENESFKSLGDGQEQKYTDINITPGEIYTYKLEAYDKYGNLSESNEQSGFAYSVDETAPIINIPNELFGLSGSEIMLDGTDCTDNVRISEYIWNMGNGDEVFGARAAYIYDTAGSYVVTLTVKDDKGNTAEKKFTMTVLDPAEYGNVAINVVDENNVPIKHAYVYWYTAETETEKTLKSDSTGTANITGKLGTHQIAVYKEGFLPVKTNVEINSYGENATVKVTLKSGELVTGKLTVHRMSLEEMREAGIDFNAPSNFHTFVFEVELTFAQEPIPTYLNYIYTSNGGYFGSGGTGSGGGWGGISGGNGSTATLSDGSTIQLKTIMPEVMPETEEEEILPILAYVRTSESISFMKEMYSVDLGVINNATSEFVITDSEARLILPNGLSLASTTTGTNTLTQKMGDIAGQQTKNVSWAVRGDKKGEYNVEAEFTGNLMPFNAPVKAVFKTETPFTVGVGKGLNLYIYPEEHGYIGEDYYIQYMLKNEGEYDFYNLTTTFGAYQIPENKEEVKIIYPDGTLQKYENGELIEDTTSSESPLSTPVGNLSYYIGDVSDAPLVPVLYGGQTLQIGILPKEAAVYGTYKTTFSGEGDPDEVRYRLIESLVTGLEETDIQVHVSPIPSHINKYNVKIEIVTDTFGDPVDMTTGGFIDSIPLMSVNGETPLSLNFDYNSLTGWGHNFSNHLEFNGNTIKVYWDSYNYATFVDENAVIRNVHGEFRENAVNLTAFDDSGYKDYMPISHGMEDYLLSREENGNYTLKSPNGQKAVFNSDGKLIEIIQNNGKSTTLEHNGNTTIITDSITGAKLILEHNDLGQLTVVKDENGRKAYVAYENGLVKTITNALGETISYTYDENNRVISAVAGSEETPYVINEYDENSRVIKQYDALKNITTFSYKELGDGNLNATAIDRKGNTVKYTSNNIGRVLSYTDQNNSVTSYAYDDNGNLISETNGNGNKISYEYDDKNNIIQIEDYFGELTEMTYDENGNILKVNGSNGEESSYTYTPNNLLQTTIENSGAKKTYTYNTFGQIVTETITGLGVKTYEYENGRIAAITDYSGNKTTMSYDSYGNLASVTDRNGNKTSYSYDLLGRQIAEITADGTISCTYDYRGNKTSVTDRRGNKTTYTYNGNNLLVKETNAKGEVTKYSYDNEGHLAKTENSDGTTFTNAYDNFGNIIKTVNENGEICEYSYDNAGNILTKTLTNNGSKNTESYEYYVNGKIKKIIFADGTSESYEYDKAWRQTKITDSLGNSEVYTYDKCGNLTSVTDREGNKTVYTYDIYGRILSETDPNGNVTTFDEYDANGNCLQKTNPNGTIALYEYTAENQLSKMTIGEISVSYKYDSAGRVTKYTNEEGNTSSVNYDENGNVVSLTDSKGNVILSFH